MAGCTAPYEVQTVEPPVQHIIVYPDYWYYPYGGVYYYHRDNDDWRHHPRPHPKPEPRPRYVRPYTPPQQHNNSREYHYTPHRR